MLLSAISPDAEMIELAMLSAEHGISPGLKTSGGIF
jgi:hypothetical protein